MFVFGEHFVQRVLQERVAFDAPAARFGVAVDKQVGQSVVWCLYIPDVSGATVAFVHRLACDVFPEPSAALWRGRLCLFNKGLDRSFARRVDLGDDVPVVHRQLLLDLFADHDVEDTANLPTRSETLLRTTINQILLLLSFLQPDAPYPAENELVGSLMKYLNEHLTESISLEEMARIFFVSKYHLCHTFREHTGTSIISYLTTKRIALAQQHLEDGIPAIRVAELVGFRDYSVFYRAYRKIVGRSPSYAKGTVKKQSRILS